MFLNTKIFISIILLTNILLNANNDMRIISKDIKEVEIEDRVGNSCIVMVKNSDRVIKTDCVRLINSKRVKILCTYKKRICKTENEIFEFVSGKHISNITKKSKKLKQGMPYSEAREIILNTGWQGKNSRWQDIPDSGEIGIIYYDNGWQEVQDCSGTGMAYCKFEFINVKNQTLAITTSGECQKTAKVKCEKYLEYWGIE